MCGSLSILPDMPSGPFALVTSREQSIYTALIPCLAAYILSPIPCVAAYIHLFLLFGTVLQNFNENFLLSCIAYQFIEYISCI